MSSDEECEDDNDFHDGLIILEGCPCISSKSCEFPHALTFVLIRHLTFESSIRGKKIAFKGSADGTIQQRAWDDLLPKRILMYCMKHKIVPDIWTPKRNHICFPSIVWKRNQEGRRTKMMSERRSNAFGNFRVIDTEKMPKVVERQFDTVTYGDTASKKGKSSTMHKMISSFEDNKSIPITISLEQPSSIIPIKSPNKDIRREQRFTSKPVKKMEVTTPPKADAEMKTIRIRAQS
ncbi:hypothetical protein L1987_55446 [Smallanthus sonchifolius]|uniref:Uncharacterized protein n=1 Tax=Smallanthus sonchifolius TaxID=185202 RepID=A0ACB9EA22_9ASTR|nr:hypothetical protein L1987_55446 [Smallanthus sonchifolius]